MAEAATNKQGAGAPPALRLAWFVSPHGFGHAARSAAVVAALRERCLELGRALDVTFYTSVPRWFFAESLDFPLGYRELACDVGLVQRSALEEDLPATIERLERFWAEAEGFHRREIRSQLSASNADAVVCDIAPLGLVAARDAGLPSILLESFTWDWIYEPLAAVEPRFAPWVDRLRALFALADLRIRAEPACGEPKPAATDSTPPPPAPTSESPPECSSFPSMEAFPSLSFFSASMERVSVSASGLETKQLEAVVHVPPIARRPRSSAEEVRARLGLAPASAGRPLILVSMGGIPWSFENLEAWRGAASCDFVVPGGGAREERRGNLVLLPHHSPVHHPDLVAAADVVVGKLGYSTVAEAVIAGTRFLYLPRPGFREHPVLAEYVERRLPARELALDEFTSGAWVSVLSELLKLPRPARIPSDGAALAAAAVRALVDSRPPRHGRHRQAVPG